MKERDQQLAEDAIVALNQLKIAKLDFELCERINTLQREIEDRANVTAIELDDTYRYPHEPDYSAFSDE